MYTYVYTHKIYIYIYIYIIYISQYIDCKHFITLWSSLLSSTDADFKCTVYIRQGNIVIINPIRELPFESLQRRYLNIIIISIVVLKSDHKNQFLSKFNFKGI